MKNQTDMEHDVFISYSRKDEELVKKIRAALTQANISYWIDKEEKKRDFLCQSDLTGCV